MAKKILLFIFIVALTSVAPKAAAAPEVILGVLEQIDEPDINITVEQSVLYVTGAAGQTLEVVSLTGKLVTTVKIESPAQRVELNIPKGCYILKIGKVVRKVAIR